MKRQNRNKVTGNRKGEEEVELINLRERNAKVSNKDK